MLETEPSSQHTYYPFQPLQSHKHQGTMVKPQGYPNCFSQEVGEKWSIQASSSQCMSLCTARFLTTPLCGALDKFCYSFCVCVCVCCWEYNPGLQICEVRPLPLNYISLPGPTINSFMWSQPRPHLCMVRGLSWDLQLWEATTHSRKPLTLTLTSELGYPAAFA